MGDAPGMAKKHTRRGPTRRVVSSLLTVQGGGAAPSAIHLRTTSRSAALTMPVGGMRALLH